MSTSLLMVHVNGRLGLPESPSSKIPTGRVEVEQIEPAKHVDANAASGDRGSVSDQGSLRSIGHKAVRYPNMSMSI